MPQFLFRTINNNKIKEVPPRAATFFKNTGRKILITATGADPLHRVRSGRAVSKCTARSRLRRSPANEQMGVHNLIVEAKEATDWQAHTVRGFISGTLGKKMGLTVNSGRREDGERVYTLVG